MARYHHMVNWSEHKRWREWAAIYQTKALLLGLPVGCIGWWSLTINIEGIAYDADTMERVAWEPRYDGHYGENAFNKWLRDNPVTSHEPQRSEGEEGNDNGEKTPE